MADYSYLGSGRIYLRDTSVARALFEVGNASALAFAITEDVKELKDFTQPGGGTYNEVRRISAVEAQMTLHDLSPSNLERALYGTQSAVTTSTVTDESHVDVVMGALIPTDFLPSSITLVERAPATALVLNSDYEVRPGGIVMLAGGTNTVVAGDDILITYVKATHDVVNALTQSGKEYELVFDGLNEARTGKRTRITAYRTKIGAAANLALIGEDYAGMELTGKLLKDTTKVGAGISQYFKVEIQT